MPEVRLPTLHSGQISILQASGRLNAARCGRRYGKTLLLITLAADGAAKGRKVGLFAPEHRQLREPYDALLWILRDVKKQASKTEGTIRTINNGAIDFWALNDNELAGRGREYDLIIIDEAAFTKDAQMMDIWRKSLSPTMVTRPKAQAWALSTPNGNNPENFFWKICNDPTLNFIQHYAPTSENPYVPPEELEREKRDNHPQVFLQEFLAEFVDWSGTAFFLSEKLLLDGAPVPYPPNCDFVVAVIDTAVKTGTDNDGTAVSYYAKLPDWTGVGYKLVVLDWDIMQIDGALLELWIPNVFARLEELARECGARHGSIGVYIEDAQSGSILLQQCALRGLPAAPLPEKLTSVGKDGRALNASGPIWRGEVKFSEPAFTKTTSYKGATRNHLWSQVMDFRLGDKNAARRSDDLLDTMTYAVAINLGGAEGIA